ncbi:STAS domain-containing protein [Vibrio salinus]|uniref:STAS domain-containing protein n=1 Tax=Vibrio salinus TaxID=2899784 RepID=UPI001E48839B|nr:STAS domain-containing protein [Vibrio salinus]MCE0492442.1 STAS domain-containing protein [Vibrio salinus]
METVVTQQEEGPRFSFDNEITIYTVAELKEKFYSDWSKLAGEILVDLSVVDELDGAGIQLLLQIKNDSEQNNRSVRFVNHSSLVLETFEMLNLIDRLSDPVINPED